MVEWSITTDCKSVGFGLRGFESLPTHKSKLKAPELSGAFSFYGREGFEGYFQKQTALLLKNPGSEGVVKLPAERRVRRNPVRLLASERDEKAGAMSGEYA